MSRVLITGITGYIGSHLARALLPEWEVYGLVREPLNLEYLEDIQEKIHAVWPRANPQAEWKTEWGLRKRM